MAQKKSDENVENMKKKIEFTSFNTNIDDVNSRTVIVVVGVVLALEGVVGDVVEPDDGLVGVLDDEVLAVLLLHDEVDDAADDAPRVVHVQVDLGRELARLELLRAQNDVAGGVLHVEPGDVSVINKRKC